MMRWMEIINVRATGRNNQQLLREVAAGLPKEARPEGLLSIRVFERAFVETDLSIHLDWDCPCRDGYGSPFAMRIVDALQDFSLVDHAIWTEIPA